MNNDIIKIELEPSANNEDVTFETAFGEYSEVRGRGRARRKKKVAERNEVRATRRQGRDDRKENRIVKKTERKSLRQDRKDMKVERRQGRKNIRKTGQVERRSMGREEVSPDPGLQETANTGTEEVSQTYEEPISNSNEEVGYNESSSYKPNKGFEEQGEEPVYDEEELIDEEVGESDEESGFTGEIGFDGNVSLSDDDIKWEEYFSGADGANKINPEVKTLARQIEKHKEFINRLDDKLSQYPTEELQREINSRELNLERLESTLANYSKVYGDYSEARGGRSGVAKRKAEVRQAKKIARKERKQAIRTARKTSRQERKGKAKSGCGCQKGLTEVENSLEPEISENRIEVPSEESAFGGLISLDEHLQDDGVNFSYANGKPLTEEEKKKRKKLVIGVSAGLLVAGLAIFGITKYLKK